MTADEMGLEKHKGGVMQKGALNLRACVCTVPSIYADVSRREPVSRG